MERCYFCKGKIVAQNVKMDFWWGDELFLIENVPAEVCQQCGERFFDSEVSKQLDKTVSEKKQVKRSLNVPVLEYQSV